MITEGSERHPVDRLAEEFVQLYRRGERPSITDYARRYPDLAVELQELLTALVLMEEHGPAADATGADGDAGIVVADGRIPERLGEYRILREIGRGGMGVVYEAVQESLGRHVALKVLPATALLDTTRLKRFQREVQAAARLHHTNIVPVFGVGESDGLRFYAMQFIAAQSLDKVIDEVRQLKGTPGSHTTLAEAPSDGREAGEGNTASAALSTNSNSPSYYHSVARLGEQVAEALAHAHRQGILHRDIKPANLLLDSRGTVWVTDFGLAAGEGMEELTQTGDVVGTLRYMAPERLQGQGDARADVYSLGLTLYELLTVRPAFDAPDRAALIRQITDASPPVPRKLDPRIPRDLETIVLKACAKEPARRYTTAEEFADDLRRFLGNRPIEARRTPWWEQAWRWCRRNPGVAAASTTALAALLVGLGVSLWQWRRADDHARQAETSASQADNSRLHAEASASQAEKDFELSLDAIEQMLERVGVSGLEVVPHMDRTRRALLEDAVRFYQTLLRGREDHPKGRLAMARAHWRLGQIYAPLGDGRKSVESLDRALSLVQELLQSEPNHADARRLEGAIYAARGATNHYVLRRSSNAEADIRQALAVWDRLRAEQPDQSNLFAGSRALALISLADLLRTESRLREAEASSRLAIEAAEALPATHPHRSRLLANALNVLGLVLKAKGDSAEGERVFRRVVPLYEDSAKQSPEPYRRYELAIALRRLGEYEMQSSATRGQAENLFQRSLRLSERLIADFPDVPLYRDALAATANQYGVLLDIMARPADAERIYDRAAVTWRELVTQSPKSAHYRVGLAGALHNLARVKQGRGDLTGARALFEEAIALQEEAVRLNHREPNALEYLGNHYRDLISALVKLKQLQEAEKAIDRQLAVARELAAKDGEWPAVRVFQARAWENVSRMRERGRQLDKAAQACREAAGHRRRLTADFPNNPDYASELGGLLNDWVHILARQGRWAEALPLVDEAITAQDAALRARPTRRQYRLYLVNHYHLRGDALIGLGEHAAIPPAAEAARARLPESFNDYSWAILMTKCIPLAEKDQRLGPDEQVRLAGEYAERAMALLQAAHRKKSTHLSGIHTDPAFAPLRDRPDFQHLLATVAKPGK